MEKVTDDNNCFACGKNNSIGLKLEFEESESGVRSSVKLDKNFQGWKSMAHGGIISTLLDEAMVKSASSKKITCVTAEIKVKFKSPCFLGKDYILRGSVVDVKKRVIITEAKLIETSGKIVALGEGKLFVVNKHG